MSHPKPIIPRHRDDATADQRRRNEIARRVGAVVLVFACVFAIWGTWSVAQYIDDARAMAEVARRRPDLSIRRRDAGRVPRCYHACYGGGDSMLRVSYHDMILAWGRVPSFCVDGEGSVNGVVTVEANAVSAALREEVRGLLRSELRIVGKVEFDVEGDVIGVGHLRCKTFLLEGKGDESNKGQCLVH
ncbi:unnamed protein product [Urochloa decumbens]|uniref:Uncharacterized protein n=1 Tax=Urochloa decumbens TaxID=240449 RepID=A0ABC9A8C1_9POAL